MRFIGKWLARYLDKPRANENRVSTCRPEQLYASLRKVDVLLVEGSSRICTAIQYLTQSTWSHSALNVSDNHTNPDTCFDFGSDSGE